MIRKEPKPPIIGQRNGINIRANLKPKKKINQMSNGKYKQTKEEQKLKKELLIESNGVCQNCHKAPDFRGLSKHEIIFRSHGGNPLDRNNVILVCNFCHSQFHHIREKRNGY